MKICLYGAGAIGGMLATLLAKKGEEVSVVDVGPTLEAIQTHGMRLKKDGEIISAKVNATSDPTSLGPQDLVITAVKGPVLRIIAPKMAPLFGPNTMVLTAMNGVPWWFFQGFGGQYEGTALESVDEGGVIAKAIPASRLLACVILLSCRSAAPGVAEHVSGNKLIVGQPDNAASPRVTNLASLLTSCGFEVSISSCIQKDIWTKLMNNMTHNPISALTGATMDRIIGDPLVNEFCVNLMKEGGRVGAKFGCVMPEGFEEKATGLARSLGAFKTSMLQDLEGGRGLELDALIGAVAEIAKKVGEPTPFIDALFGLARLKGRVMGLYPQEKKA